MIKHNIQITRFGWKWRAEGEKNQNQKWSTNCLREMTAMFRYKVWAHLHTCCFSFRFILSKCLSSPRWQFEIYSCIPHTTDQYLRQQQKFFCGLQQSNRTVLHFDISTEWMQFHQFFFLSPPFSLSLTHSLHLSHNWNTERYVECNGCRLL